MITDLLEEMAPFAESCYFHKWELLYRRSCCRYASFQHAAAAVDCEESIRLFWAASESSTNSVVAMVFKLNHDVPERILKRYALLAKCYHWKNPPDYAKAAQTWMEALERAHSFPVRFFSFSAVVFIDRYLCTVLNLPL